MIPKGEASVPHLKATIEAVADGIIAVDLQGRVITYNRKFAELWQMPETMLASADDKAIITFIRRQVADEGAFHARIAALYSNPEAENEALFTLKDGRVFERYSKPYRFDGRTAGLVLSFRDVTDRIKTEARFRRVSEANLLGIIFADLHGAITEANPYFLGLVGYSRADLEAGRVRWTDLTPPEYKSADEKALEELRRWGVCNSYEKQYIRKDGTRVFVLIGAAMLEGSKDESVTFVLDITDRKAAESALRFSEERFRVIFESAPISIVLGNMQLQLLEVNPAFCRLTGYSRDELIENGIEHISHPDEYPTELELLTRLRAGEIASYTFEKRFIRKDGQTRWANVFVALGRDAQRNPIFIVGTGVNITEHKNTLEALKGSEEKYRELYTHTPVMMHSIDSEGKLISVSDYWLESLGYEREEVLGRKSLEFMTPRSREHAEECVLPKYFESGVCKDVPYQLVTKSGAIVDVLLSAIAEKDEAGKVIRSLAVLIDVTERKRAEEERNRLLVAEKEAKIQAQAAVRLRDDFIAIASHELRTPITPLKLQVQFILRHLKTGLLSSPEKLEEFAKLLTTADHQLDRLSKQIEDMLNVSRISAGSLVLQMTRVDLSDSVRRVVARRRHEYEAAGCALSLELAPDVRGEWDTALLEQVIVNLLSNAIKYGRGKPIEIRVFAEDSTAKLVVQDHGIGIAKEDQARIFERFGRVLSIKEYGGFGLGLYLTRQIVAAHGGVLLVESEPGAGSRFTVALPLMRARGAA